MAERDPIDVIKEQISKVDALAGLDSEHQFFLQWHADTKLILEKIFSARSIHTQSFLALRFREVSAKGFASPEVDKINSVRYRKGIENARNVLQGAIKELTLDRTLFKKMQTTPESVDVLLQGEYFISSGFSEPGTVQAIEDALEGSGLKSTCSALTRESLSMSDRIEQIKRARFGIYEISGERREEVLMELGAALGLGREVILLRKIGGTPLPEPLEQLGPVEYGSASELIEILRKRIKI